MDHHRVALPQGDQLLVMVEHRIGIGQCGLGIDLLVVRIDRDPRGAGGKAGLRTVIPLDGGTGIVPADRLDAGPEHLVGDVAALTPFLVGVDALDVSKVCRAGEGIVGHPQLLALVDVGGPLHHVETGGQHLSRQHPVLGTVVAKTGYGPGLVVVVPEQAVPGLSRKLRLPGGQDLLEPGEGHLFTVPFPKPAGYVHMGELEHHIELMAVLPGIATGLLGGHARGLSYGHQIVVGQYLFVHLL